MARFPDSFIEELKEKTDLVKLVKEYTQLREVGLGIWQGVCPNPEHNDGTPSFTVWQKHNSWSCYGCHSGKKGVDGNVGSDAIAFLQWIEKLDFRQAVIKLAKWNDIPIPNDKNQKEFKRNDALAFKYKKALHNNVDVLEYLYERGLDDTDIESFGIGYDNYNKRIVFPLYDKYRNIVGFNKRVTKDNEAKEVKYKNSSNSDIFNKSSYLYGIHNLDDSCNEIRITEGSMDVILAHKYGVKNVVATLGTSFTESHAKMIYKLGKTPVLIFDGDDAGRKGLYKALSYFEALGVYCKIIELPMGKDLADMANDMKFDLEKYINRCSVTAGYLQLRNIISEYQSSLYELKLYTTPKIEEVLDFVPYTEKRVLKSFVKDELNISL